MKRLAAGLALVTSATSMISVLLVASPARADNAHEPRRFPMAIGFNLDLMPTVMSGVNGKLGYGPQVWLGIDRARVRFAGTHLEPPDRFAFAAPGFRHPTTTSFAAMIDYMLGPSFEGSWIGAGFEIWQKTIEYEGISGTARWTSVVFAFAGGYMWRVTDDCFLDPSAGAYFVLNPQTVTIGPNQHNPFPVQGEISLKIGCSASL
jgi:hypothetical protein